MNENEKAAIAARLWEPGRYCEMRQIDEHHSRCPCGYMLAAPPRSGGHDVSAPDMHDPANLWRALENRNADAVPGFTINGGEGTWSVELYLGHSVKNPDGSLSAKLIEIERQSLTDAVFAALVALYDAEHPTEKPAEVAK